MKGHEELTHYPKVSEALNLLEETLQDDIEHLRISEDHDAKIGHKTVDTSFFGYKTHIAMTKERIITAATITTGEKNDVVRIARLYFSRWRIEKYFRYKKQVFQFENFRVRKLKSINALNLKKAVAQCDSLTNFIKLSPFLCLKSNIPSCGSYM